MNEYIEGSGIRRTEAPGLLSGIERLNRRGGKLREILTDRELAYLSRAIFRQRMDKPEDEPELAAQLDPLISAARPTKTEAS